MFLRLRLEEELTLAEFEGSPQRPVGRAQEGGVATSQWLWGVAAKDWIPGWAGR